MMISYGATTVISIAAASIASITGFGIGSILTPLFSLGMDTKTAVACVSVPHFVATFIRFWMLRAHVDRRVLFRFGLMSAGGGLLGAVLHSRFGAPALTVVFGSILIFAGAMGVGGYSERLRFGRKAAWIAGGASGFLGGLVGNQGGIRSAAMMSFNVSKEAFVATATAVGVIVDVARMPVYFITQGKQIADHRSLIAVAIVGVVIGTFLGTRYLKRIPERTFRRLVSIVVLVLGVVMFLKGVQ